LRKLANCPECLSGNEKEKKVVMEEQKTIKGAHKPCKYHPDKYAVKTVRIKADSPGEAWEKFQWDISKSNGYALFMRVGR
jgi:NAD(P)H-dependent flavin oxidoreductase YrpB (nitropropane dioxygenase family)